MQVSPAQGGNNDCEEQTQLLREQRPCSGCKQGRRVHELPFYKQQISQLVGVKSLNRSKSAGSHTAGCNPIHPCHNPIREVLDQNRPGCALSSI